MKPAKDIIVYIYSPKYMFQNVQNSATDNGLEWETTRMSTNKPTHKLLVTYSYNERLQINENIKKIQKNMRNRSHKHNNEKTGTEDYNLYHYFSTKYKNMQN